MILPDHKLNQIDYWHLNKDSIKVDVITICWKGKMWPFNKSKFKFQRSLEDVDGTIHSYRADGCFTRLYRQLTAWSHGTFSEKDQESLSDVLNADGDTKEGNKDD